MVCKARPAPALLEWQQELQLPVLSIIPKIEPPPANGESRGGLARKLRAGQVAGKRGSPNGGSPARKTWT